MTECIFCKIINKEIPADVIYEDDKTMAFMDIRPVSRGHCLVIPKSHAANIFETDDQVVAETISRTKKIASAVQKAVGAEGITISANTGEAAGQTVFHLHFHVIPRFKKDGLQPWPHHDQKPKSRTELAEEIRKQLT